ncbi:hypothetical protein JOC85_003932 [Bacillus mesophilus]|uniref:Uncharacterized protein n=1 Tax=Bacillus mesophilus TaxID=1808955 RepID=A0A6M0QB75_9BACI|nr:hypothetical protein [Bacillus mesophilus]MBM7663106.1 hypothetical protein [Bacillus mesophilus]NEY73575.1 hypothetical protein [Bacillus mesophilus]
MPMEEETIELVKTGSTIFIGLAIVITIFFWFKNRSKPLIVHGAYLHLIGHFLLLSITIYSAIRTISFDVMLEDGTIHPMASEEVSLKLGVTGLIWAGSMMLLMVSIFMFSMAIKRGSITDGR